MQLFALRTTRNFMGGRALAATISLVLIAVAVGSVLQRGINYGIDFLGGLKLTYTFASAGRILSDGDILAALADAQTGAMVQRFGAVEEQRFVIKIKQPSIPTETLLTQVDAALRNAFGEGVRREGEEMVGPRVGHEMKLRGQKTVLYVLLALLLYIGFRFDFLFAPGAIIALAHDVIITVGVLAWLGVEFNLTILAALLTIAGYSINDTIIIYDRIREHRKEIPIAGLTATVNKSLSETLPRTVVTSLTTLLVVLILYSIAGGDIRDFALTFMIGIVVGTYSSLYIASPIYMFAFQRWAPTK